MTPEELAEAQASTRVLFRKMDRHLRAQGRPTTGKVPTWAVDDQDPAVARALRREGGRLVSATRSLDGSVVVRTDGTGPIRRAVFGTPTAVPRPRLSPGDAMRAAETQVTRRWAWRTLRTMVASDPSPRT